jgi:translation initiation factor 2 beta subunit (eIF-2beta)/eIF-5
MDIPEWDGLNPDFIIKRMKAIPKLELQSWGKREFYKSYSDKLSMEQRNKTLSYFRSLPQEVQGNVFNGVFFFHFYFIQLSILLTCSNLLSDQLVEEAMLDSEQAAQANVVRNAQMMKDDIVRLIHLYKEPQVELMTCNDTC